MLPINLQIGLRDQQATMDQADFKFVGDNVARCSRQVFETDHRGQVIQMYSISHQLLADGQLLPVYGIERGGRNVTQLKANLVNTLSV